MSDDFSAIWSAWNSAKRTRRTWFKLVQRLEELAAKEHAARHITDSEQMLLAEIVHSLSSIQEWKVSEEDALSHLVNLIDTTIDVLQLDAPTLLLVPLLIDAGNFHSSAADLEPAALSRALGHYRAAADLAASFAPREAAVAHLGIASILMRGANAFAIDADAAKGDPYEEPATTALAHLEAARDFARSTRDPQLQCSIAQHFAAAWLEQLGNTNEAAQVALSHLDEALVHARAVGSRSALAQVEHNRAIALLAGARGDKRALDDAVAGFERALELRRQGAPEHEAETRLALGTALAKRGASMRIDADFSLARGHLNKAAQIYGRLPRMKVPHSTALMHLANAMRDQARTERDRSRASSLYKRALEVLPAEATAQAALIVVNEAALTLSSDAPLDPPSKARHLLHLEEAKLALHSRGEFDAAATAEKLIGDLRRRSD